MQDLVWIVKNGILKIKHLENVIALVTTKSLGNQLDRKLYTRFLKTLNLTPDDIVLPQQIHGSKVVFVTADDTSKRIYNADGLITNADNVGLGIFVADCVPLFIYDKTTGYIGLIHVGWKGLLKGIIENTTDILLRKNCNLRNADFFLGPHICGECYTFSKHDGKKFIYGYENGKLNLFEEIKKRLKKYGVRKIFNSGFCSYHQNEIFYSYRRGEVDSRMLALIIKQKR